MFFLKSKRNGATHREQQLAQESGYHSYSTFSAAFRQRMHKNVTDWMREEVFLQMWTKKQNKWVNKKSDYQLFVVYLQQMDSGFRIQFYFWAPTAYI